MRPTSREAYERILPKITERQGYVLRAIGDCYVTDENVALHYVLSNFPTQSPSGLRSRRAELVKLGLVEEAEGYDGRTKAGNRCMSWRATPDGLRKLAEMRGEESQ
jgi:hypothetical protein